MDCICPHGLVLCFHVAKIADIGWKWRDKNNMLNKMWKFIELSIKKIWFRLSTSGPRIHFQYCSAIHRIRLWIRKYLRRAECDLRFYESRLYCCSRLVSMVHTLTLSTVHNVDRITLNFSGKCVLHACTGKCIQQFILLCCRWFRSEFESFGCRVMLNGTEPNKNQ